MRRPHSSRAASSHAIPTLARRNEDRAVEDVGDSDPRALESEALTQNRGHPMAMGHTIQFSDASIDKYDEVQDALGWHDGTGAPEGLLAHAAGTTENGFCVVEWWKGGDRLGQVLCGAAHAGVREGRRYSSASDNVFRRALDVHRCPNTDARTLSGEPGARCWAPVRRATDARIILACAEAGTTNKAVAARLRVNAVTVGKWRARFVARRYPPCICTSRPPRDRG